MDVLDPAFAPAVQNPEADGISTGDLLDIVCALCDKRVVGFDVVEIAPVYDQGISAIVAAKVIFEMLCQIEKSQNDFQKLIVKNFFLTLKNALESESFMLLKISYWFFSLMSSRAFAFLLHQHLEAWFRI